MTKLVSIRIDTELWKRFRLACMVSDTNASNQVEALVREWTDTRKPKEQA